MISGPGEERWCLALWALRWDESQLQPTPPTMPIVHLRHSSPSRYGRSRAFLVVLGAPGPEEG